MDGAGVSAPTNTPVARIGEPSYSIPSREARTRASNRALVRPGRRGGWLREGRARARSTEARFAARGVRASSAAARSSGRCAERMARREGSQRREGSRESASPPTEAARPGGSERWAGCRGRGSRVGRSRFRRGQRAVTASLAVSEPAEPLQPPLLAPVPAARPKPAGPAAPVPSAPANASRESNGNGSTEARPRREATWARQAGHSRQ